MAHLIVQPTGPTLDDLHPTVLLFHELVDAGIPKSNLVAALCRVLNDEEEAAARTYLEEAGYEVLDGSIPESIAYRIAHNRGRSLTETDEQAFNDRADALIDVNRLPKETPKRRAKKTPSEHPFVRFSGAILPSRPCFR
jgi:chromosome partitioning protein